MLTVVHLVASPFLGGPERQMLGLAATLSDRHRTVFLSFAERGLSLPFLDRARRDGFEAETLARNFPHLLASAREVSAKLRRHGADVVCCHGYKPDLVGLPASRWAGIPVVSVSRGWTGATRRVRVHEALDRASLRWMDRVVCVSEGQAVRVRRAGVPARRVVVIRNAIRAERFDVPDPSYRERLRGFFPRPRARVVGAAGRLSPEKGFEVLVEAAAVVLDKDPEAGFIHFGEGPSRESIARRIADLGLEDRFILAGFRDDVDAFLPHLDLVVLPSFTEGLPNVALEASAAGVPLVATAVGGTPEVVEEGTNGYLVPPGDPAALALRILDVLGSEEDRIAMGRRGRERIRDFFTFEAQAAQYERLFDELTSRAGVQGVAVPGGRR